MLAKNDFNISAFKVFVSSSGFLFLLIKYTGIMMPHNAPHTMSANINKANQKFMSHIPSNFLIHLYDYTILFPISKPYFSSRLAFFLFCIYT